MGATGPLKHRNELSYDPVVRPELSAVGMSQRAIVLSNIVGQDILRYVELTSSPIEASAPDLDRAPDYYHCHNPFGRMHLRPPSSNTESMRYTNNTSSHAWDASATLPANPRASVALCCQSTSNVAIIQQTRAFALKGLVLLQ
ncbi:hypothetical protein BFJ72_g9521 [Fusarium proliferatum]|uniref:Uncharacterized protein n=1 Tax=Gibberella intermedia TaxID=948311 RepID=A0A420SXQ7_GIBIN|nr:hypothetical protein BFJ72_g9521 [Fusarium proliferatum]